MAQAGAQREPSMEEILASIRRIIENNDPAEIARTEHDDSHDERDEQPVQAAEPEVDHGQAQPDTSFNEDQEDAGEAELSSHDRLEVVHASAPDADNGAGGAGTISLADVAARAKGLGLSDQAAAAVSAQVAPVQSAASIPAPVNDDISSKIDDAVAEELRQALVSDEPVAAAPDAEEAPHAHSEAAAEPADTLEKPAYRRAGRETEIADDRQDDAPAGQQGGQLVSMQTGEKVAAAFGELTAAIAAGQTRSFDEIAEEMLKPMLTQWLDDNLPTLVERLVREEIERVSRGTRR
ncbi:MAG: DUF2497 domain-containing protein [Hoeflea sp.]|uniref:PopZ family protein n=1 Tax=Hoeflea sp. TaxID=1940281 RepID=UPI0032EB23E3